MNMRYPIYVNVWIHDCFFVFDRDHIPLRSFEVPITPAEKTTSLTKLRCASRCARSGPGYALIYHNGGIYMDTDFLAIDMSSIIDPCDGSREKPYTLW